MHAAGPRGIFDVRIICCLAYDKGDRRCFHRSAKRGVSSHTRRVREARRRVFQFFRPVKKVFSILNTGRGFAGETRVRAVLVGSDGT